MTLIFDSIADALEHLYETENWEWGGSSSYEGLCEWAFKNATVETYQSECNVKDKAWIRNIVHDYLRAVGETPADYLL